MGDGGDGSQGEGGIGILLLHLRRPFAGYQGLNCQSQITPRAPLDFPKARAGDLWIDKVHMCLSEMLDWVAWQQSTDRRSVQCVCRTGVLLSESVGATKARGDEMEGLDTGIRLLQLGWNQFPRTWQVAKAGALFESEFQRM